MVVVVGVLIGEDVVKASHIVVALADNDSRQQTETFRPSYLM